MSKKDKNKEAARAEATCSNSIQSHVKLKHRDSSESTKGSHRGSKKSQGHSVDIKSKWLELRRQDSSKNGK